MNRLVLCEVEYRNIKMYISRKSAQKIKETILHFITNFHEFDLKIETG